MAREDELVARLDELERLARYIPPAILAERITLGVSSHLRCNGHGEVVTECIRERFAEWHTSTIAAPESVEPAEEEPPEEESVSSLPVDSSEEEALAEPEFKATVEETKPKNKPGRPISTPIANGEGEKPCTDCGETKPLSEFAKNAGSKDRRRNECKTCHNQRRRAKPEKATDNRRRCANGENCAVFDQLNHPAPLTSGNPGPTCFRCQEKERENARNTPTKAAIPGTRGRG